MTVASKLQIKHGQRVAVVNAPPDIDLELPHDTQTAPAENADVVIAFVTNREELDDAGAPAVAAALRDGLAWVAYPKGGQQGTDLNRDSSTRR